MNVAEELRAQAKRVEAGWVRFTPEEPGEASATAWEDERGFHTVSPEAEGFLSEYLQRRLIPEMFDAAGWGYTLPAEGGPVNRRQVAAVLRRAADRWEREHQEVAPS